MMSENDKEQPKKICGIVMPISLIDGCDEQHWSDVQEILSEAIEAAGFEANLVSNADEVGLIHKRIIQNLYDNPIVVCDVSGKNPNVMFELGIRLAFDKPTIIVKDDKTSYSFDTSSIEHLGYPRDLRFGKIVEFKERLSEKIKKTYEASASDTAYTTFLKHFGEFKVAKIEKKEVSGQEFIIDELKSIRFALNRLERGDAVRRKPRGVDGDIDICLRQRMGEINDNLISQISKIPGVISVKLDGPSTHKHLFVSLSDSCDKSEIKSTVDDLLPPRQGRNARLLKETLDDSAKTVTRDDSIS